MDSSMMVKPRCEFMVFLQLRRAHGWRLTLHSAGLVSNVVEELGFCHLKKRINAVAVIFRVVVRVVRASLGRDIPAARVACLPRLRRPLLWATVVVASAKVDAAPARQANLRAAHGWPPVARWVRHACGGFSFKFL